MHEMGRSYIELGHYDEAAEYARMAQLAAEEGGDDVWVLNARVMEAQCHCECAPGDSGRFEGCPASFLPCLCPRC